MAAQDAGLDPRVGELLHRSTSTSTEALAWLGDIWQYFLDSGLYLSGGPADHHTSLRLKLKDRIQEVAASVDANAVWAEADRICAHVLNAGEHYREAVDLYAKAIRELEAEGLHETAAKTRLGYASALNMTGAHLKALTVCKQADAWFERNGDVGAHARALVNAGNVYHRIDEHAKALECHEEAARIFESSKNETALATATLNIANSYAFLDRFEESETMYRQTEEIAARCGLGSLADQARYNRAYLFYLRGRYSDAIASFNGLGRKFTETGSWRHAALCDLDLSEIYLQLNLPGDAGRLAERAERVFADLSMGYEAAKAIALLGVAETAQGRHQEALERLRQAEEMFIAEDNEFWTAAIKLYRAQALLSLGRHWEARILAENSLAKYSARDMSYQKGLALVVLGRALLALGGTAQLEEVSGSLLELVATARIPLVEIPAYMLCGQIAEHAGRVFEAKRHYTQAARCLEEHRRYLHHDELRVRFLEGKDAVYESLVHIDLHHGECSDVGTFEWCERAKARSLTDLVSPHLPMVRADADPALFGRIQRLREELNSRYVRSRPLEGNSNFHAPVPAKETRRLEDQFEDGLRQLVKADVQFGSLVGASPVKLADIQAVLPEDTTLVEYFVAREEVAAFVVTRRVLRVYKMPAPWSVIRQCRQGLDFQVQKFALGDAWVASHQRQMLVATTRYLGRLYDCLVAPWIDQVCTSNLLMIPHGELHALPLHALFDGKRYLIDRFRISYAPSAEVFRRTALAGPGATGPGLLIGRADVLAPAIDDEIARLAALAPESRVYTGERATRNALFDGASAASFVHVSTHGFFKKDNPMFSGFELADGPVTALDLYSRSWPNELVTLSGCSTGVSHVTAGDELLGVVRGFLHAGARSLLLSLWNVSDEATVLLIESFYRKWRKGMGKAGAIRYAMGEVRAKYQHPFYWAPFQLIGRP